MPRFIDSEKIVNYEVKLSDGKDYVLIPVKHLYDIPSVDVVKVVRCKDCIHRHDSEFCECRPKDGFCNDGELEVEND
jgi:hypothetical protein